MNQFLSNKIIAGVVALALLVGVGVLVSSGDTSSTTRNAALVVATPCAKPGQVTKVSKQSVVCATTNTGSLWYATMKAKGKAQLCTKPGAIRKKSNIVWVCGVVKKKKLWQATQPLPPAVVAAITVIEPGETQPTPALDSTQVATPDVPVVADNTVLADTKIPEDKIVTQVIDDATPVTTPAIPLACAAGGTCNLRDIGPGGGIVFYVATTPFTCGEYPNATPATKCTYLEAAIADGTTPSTWTPSTKAQWGCKDTPVPGTSLEIGTGRANTKSITDKKCIGTDGSVSAASIAATYNGGDKSDWFLPSRKELDALCTEFFKGRSGTKQSYKSDTCMGSGNVTAVTGTTNGISWSFAAGDQSKYPSNFYWSSSDKYDADLGAWSQDFLQGYEFPGTKNFPKFVRPVRAFSATCAIGGTCAIGDAGPGGGIVFYVATTAQSWGTYLEAAPTDYQVDGSRAGVEWGCSGTLIGAADMAIGTGKTNTATILAKCSDTGIAARVAADYRGGGKSDWFLPSKDELNELCKIYSNGRTDTTDLVRLQDGCTGSASPTGGFATDFYWSSSEDVANIARYQNFSNGLQYYSIKYNTSYVRPVRAF